METVEILAQMASTGNSGIGSVDNIIAMIIQVVGAVIGIGFLIDATKDSFGKGGSNEKGKNIAKDIMWFVIVVCLFGALPKLLGLGSGFLAYL